MKYNKDKITYSQMQESFGILSDWCRSVEELLTIDASTMIARVDLGQMTEIDFRRLTKLGWKPSIDYEYLYLSV